VRMGICSSCPASSAVVEHCNMLCVCTAVVGWQQPGLIIQKTSMYEGAAVPHRDRFLRAVTDA
jgi:hypothetical protein